ncbi:MAG: type II secretion system protein GspL [Gammaproteobacteria bacterium]|nr:type II secretion system protein GspL [Gammaproteobacteria bacterium]
MAEYLVIRLGHTSDGAVEWIVADDSGTRRGQTVSGSLADAARDVRGRPVIVLVPATEVLTTTVEIPIRSGPRLRAALPFALEENLADDVDTLHFASGTRRENGKLPVAVVARARMDEWLEALDDAGISAARIVPENYGLARIPGTMSVLIDGDCVMFNDGADSEFVMQGVRPSDTLVAAGLLSDRSDDEPDDGEPSGHLVAYCEAVDEERLSHDWIALRHELHSVDVNLLPDGALPRLAVTVAGGSGVNLLQGRYGMKTDYRSKFRPWQNAAVLLLGLVIVGLVAKGVDLYRLTQEAASLQAQFIEEYRQIRPGDTREVLDPLNAVRSVKQGLGAATGPQVFLPSLRQLSDAMAQNSNARIETISYRAGVIDVRITSPDVATLDKIQKSVSASGQFQASIQSTDQVADQISSRLQIREAGS